MTQNGQKMKLQQTPFLRMDKYRLLLKVSEKMTRNVVFRFSYFKPSHAITDSDSNMAAN